MGGKVSPTEIQQFSSDFFIIFWPIFMIFHYFFGYFRILSPCVGQNWQHIAHQRDTFHPQTLHKIPSIHFFCWDFPETKQNINKNTKGKKKKNNKLIPKPGVSATATDLNCALGESVFELRREKLCNLGG